MTATYRCSETCDAEYTKPNPTISPFRQYVFDSGPIPWSYSLLDFLSIQPLKILQSKFVFFEIYLACHHPGLHEESLLPSCLCSLLLVDDGLAVIGDLVSNRHVAYHPGVHVHTPCLYTDTFCSLQNISEGQKPKL